MDLILTGNNFCRFEEILCPRRHMDDVESSRKLKIDLAFKMLSSARSDLIPHALQLLPSTKVSWLELIK